MGKWASWRRATNRCKLFKFWNFWEQYFYMKSGSKPFSLFHPKWISKLFWQVYPTLNKLSHSRWKTYCKSGNFRATLIFALFAHFWASAKLKTRASVYFVCRSMTDDWKKNANLKTSKKSQIAEARKITCVKLPLLQWPLFLIFGILAP